MKTERAEDKTILVPLTSSLYVPGKLSNVETVIVDVGTGYFVEKVGWKGYLLYCSIETAIDDQILSLYRV